MAAAGSRWPEGLNDEAALNRLEAMMLNAADGRRSISDDRQYATLRKLLRRGGDHKPRVPSLIATHPTLDSFCAFIKGVADRRERERIVRADFHGEETPGAIAQESASVIQASSWTGNPSVAQQARIVRTLGPAALAAVDALIAEQDRRHDNGGPVTPDEIAALETLKELRTALNELIRAAEANQPMIESSKRLAALGNRAFKAFTGNLKKDAGGVYTAGSTLTVSAITYAIVQSIIGMSDTAALAFAGVGATAFIAGRK